MRAADLRRLRGATDAAWREELDREVSRIVALPEPAERMRAYVELARVLAEEGEALPADAGDRVLRSLRTSGEGGEREGPMTAWAVERRRLAVLHGLRPIAAAGCAMAALAPFAVAAWRWGWGVGDALAAFLAPGWPLVGVALALVVAGVLARLTGRADTLEGLSGLVIAAFVAGVAGLAVAVAAT